ncbi:MAG: type IV secretory system conjugative DNA transfer family protein [Magnetococcales bacterium]|nr:type IV secretory system conjugative DNA transfer family protein [Magnetococcales bacterium]MBF0116802.1 type IV secretory system conjugative DNA transfer family protein [Magnetococcales bacterium]
MAFWGTRSNAPEPNQPQTASGFYLGERFRRDGQGQRVHGESVVFQGDEHVLLIGPTRCGKGRRLLAPNLILHPEHSAIVVDPKGELARWTGRYRAQQGHEVIYLDPFGVLGEQAESRSFNPLLALDPTSDAFLDDAMGVAEALVMIEGNDPHWSSSAQDFVAGMVMHTCLNPESDGPWLGDTRRLITSGYGVVAEFAETAIEKQEFLACKLGRFTEADSSRELASIISTAQTQTRFLDSHRIKASLGGRKASFDFSEMRHKPMTVYVILPPYHLVTHGKWLRLVIGAAIRAMQKDKRSTKRPPVLFMLDEFPQLGRMESVETSMALNAGFGIKIVAVVQHLNQLVHQYKENWETFLSGGVIAAFGPRDAFTSEYLSRLSGQEYVTVQSTSRSVSGVTQSDSKHLQATLLPHQFRELRKGELVLFMPTPDGQQMWLTEAKDFDDLPHVKKHIA